eukprot:m.166885 g.166885  ORF g.166885 m.166885 type:complete len:570 (+) comp15296_c2_seq2:149-1858(+)
MFEDAAEEDDLNADVAKEISEIIVHASSVAISAQAPLESQNLSIKEVEDNTYNNDKYDDDDDDEDDEDDGFDDDDLFEKGTNASDYIRKQESWNLGSTEGSNHFGNKQAQLGKFISKIRVEAYDGPKLKDSASHKVHAASKKEEANRQRNTDKSDRATTEQVLDPRTRLILFKLLSREFFHEINGCISTGKEANVYHASNFTSGEDLAVKVFKTSILVFKDRDRYVTGEFRFRKGYNKHNPRKMVKLWAEKEYRNLLRIQSAGINCPKPVILRSHVLVMGFLGKDGWASPKLKDAKISESKARQLYLECILILRKIYQKAKLVHGDFSEYNLLYHEGSLVVIDVSQAVEHAHPHALEFLRKDIANTNDFFRKHKVPVMTVRELFDFVTDISIADEDIGAYLEGVQTRIHERLESGDTPMDICAEEQIQEALFMKSFIPSNLDEVHNVERDLEMIGEGQTEQLYYLKATGVVVDTKDSPHKCGQKESKENQTASDEEGTDEGSEGEDSEDESDNEKEEKTWVDRSDGKQKETAEEKRERKQAVKEAKREKRKTKTPKHIKKKQEKSRRGR